MGTANLPTADTPSLIAWILRGYGIIGAGQGRVSPDIGFPRGLPPLPSPAGRGGLGRERNEVGRIPRMPAKVRWGQGKEQGERKEEEEQDSSSPSSLMDYVGLDLVPFVPSVEQECGMKVWWLWLPSQVAWSSSTRSSSPSWKCSPPRTEASSSPSYRAS